MTEENQIFGLWQQEHEYFKEQQELHPELFVQPPHVETADILARVGIIMPKTGLPLAFLKHHPLDFVVEEVQLDGSLHTVEFSNTQSPEGQPKPFISADLVKIGISTLKAVEELSKNLKLKKTQIGIAGIKDDEAVTSQKISLSGVSVEKLLNYPVTNHFLKNLAYEDKLIKKGQLNGNRFTILLRTEKNLEEGYIEKQLEDLSQNGFWNFFWLQRFGARILNHWFGLLLIQGKQERAVQALLCDSGPYDLPFIKQIRDKANQEFGNWEKIIELYKPLPSTFYYELIMLNVLKEYRHDYVAALRAIPEITQICIYAYTSFLTNKILSTFVVNGEEPPMEIPLALSKELADMAPYQQYLKADNVADDFYKVLSRLDFIKFAHRTISSKIKTKINGFKIVPEGLVIDFELGKGSYATTFLSHLFTLVEILPVPDWVQTKEYDLKQLLGTGSVNQTMEKFGKYAVTKSEKFTL